MVHLLLANYSSGRFAAVVRSLPELEAVARRAGRHDLLAWGEANESAYRLNLTGNLRAYLEHMESLSHTEWLPITRLRMAVAHLHLGDADHALAQMANVGAEPGSLHVKGLARAMLFSSTALVGRVEDARTLFGDVEPWLPTVDKRNPGNSWSVLDVSVPGLMLAGDVVRCGELYPSCVTYLSTGVMINYSSILPGNPETVAGIAAHAAGLHQRARDHFEAAIRQADELPLRLLQPTARYWYGRLLVEDPHPAEQARGRALIEAAATDFRSLEMVTYASLAEQFLRQ